MSEEIEKIELEPQVETVENVEPEPELDKADILKVIANALKAGTINHDQAAAMRMELGVFQGDFTNTQASAKVRKEKRKAQKKARRVTLNNGFKGQKVTKGRASGRGR